MATSFSSSLELVVGKDNIPRLNIGGRTSNVDREIAIHFNYVRQPILANKGVNTRSIAFLYPLSPSSSQDHYRINWAIKLSKKKMD